MKKILFILLICLFMIPRVNADDSITTIELMQTEFTPYNNISIYKGCVECGLYLGDKYIYNNFEKFYSDSNNKYIFDTLWNDLYSNDGTSVDSISVLILSKSFTELDLFAVLITGYANYDYNAVLYLNGSFYPAISSGYGSNPAEFMINGEYFSPWSAMPHYSNANPFVVGTGNFSSTWFYLPTTSFTNTTKHYNQAENTIFKIYNSDNDLINTISYGSELPQLYEWNSFDPDATYTEVNLNNYHYVILTLKDYNKKEPFETNFKVKGSIGITPVYEFGTVEKEVITDICNIGYQDFTDYRFFILKNDLINNSIYLVKSCKDNSSFKYDSTVFNITYVTDENVDDPVITFGGVNYHTIPFKELSNTVNDNTENGFIPGESGSSSTDVLDNITNYVSSFWNSLSTFMSLVTKFFNTLPIEIRAISITMFTTACTLGLIKILKA